MSRPAKEQALAIGAEPRADLLPLEVQRERRAKVLRRRMGLGVLGAIAVIAVATAASFALNVQAQVQLLDEQNRTPELIAEQGKYVAVSQVQQQLTLSEAAQQVGVSTEINWKDYLQKVQSTLPASVTIDTVNVESASPVALYSQPTAPLQGPRVATVEFSVKSSALPDVPAWLTALATLPGFADALPGSATLDEASGVYTVHITMHVNEAAYSHRFAPVEEGK